MKKILLLFYICILMCFSSCNILSGYSLCHKGSLSNFGRCSALDDNGNMYYVRPGSDDEIVMITSSGEERVLTTADDISWITVSDKVYCVEDNDTLVCYDPETGEKCAEKEFDADNIVVKAIDDELLLFTYVRSESIHGTKETFPYIVKYSDGQFEIEKFLSGTDDGGYTNQFIAVEELENTYLYYDDVGEIEDLGEGFDDMFVLDDTGYFGMSYLYANSNRLPFVFNDKLYMFEYYYITGPDFTDDETWIKLPAVCNSGKAIEFFQYDQEMFCIVEDDEEFYLVNVDLENRTASNLEFMSDVAVADVIGENNGLVYSVDDTGIVYTYDVADGSVSEFYKPEKTGKRSYYEFCGDKLLVYTYGVFDTDIAFVPVK